MFQCWPLLWWCLLCLCIVQPVPSPGPLFRLPGSWKLPPSQHWHVISTSFSAPPLLLQDTLEQTWLPMIGLRMAPWLVCSILEHYEHWLLEGFNLYILVVFGTPCSILKPILTVLLDLIIAHTCLGPAPAVLTDSNSGWILKTVVGDDCILQWNWSVLLSAMESEAEWICV